MSILPNMNLIADSLGWAVLHSLWQGVAAAGIVFVVRNLTRERASELRYFTGIVSLCALLCAFIGTFLYYYNTGAIMSGSVDSMTASTTTAMDVAFTEPTTGVMQAIPLMTNPLTHLEDFTGLIGLFWTICFAVLGVRYLSAFRLTNKLRNNGLSDLPTDWQARFTDLVTTSGVSPKVRAYFSEHVSSPITFGFLKPIVLLPAWFFTGMTPEQCEAVLLHELAHIRRHDYLTNILQIIIKTVFFYHPAVGFICKGLDTDREHACDDFAVMLTKNPESLATALGTIRLKAAKNGGVFALSADGRDAPLMHRLKRLMGTASSKTGGKSLQKNTSRGIAATAMMGSALALVMTLGATASQAHPQKQDSEALEVEKLAGAAPELKKWDSFVEDKITVNGEAYNSTAFSVTNKGGEYYIINGEKYPSKYRYGVYAKDGNSYVVKEKNGKRYMEIDGNWHRVDADKLTGSFAMPTPAIPAVPAVPAVPKPPKYAYGHHLVGGQSFATKTNTVKNQTFIKIRGKWHDIDKADLDALLPTPPITPVPAIAPASPQPPQYSYGYTKVGDDTYTVKTKHKTGKSYVQINDNWLRATVKSSGEDHGHKHIEIKGKWYNLNAGDAPWTQQSRTRSSAGSSQSTNYWINEQTREAVEAALEQAEDQREAAEDRREAALERAEDARERNLERADDLREAALERAQDQREAVQERREAALEREIERQSASMERKIELKERDIERAEQRRERDIARIERKIRDKEIEFSKSTNLSAGEIGRMQGEIGRLQGEIGRLHGQTGHDQGQLGRMQGELGRLQGKLGRIQGERAEDSQQEYYKMRDKLIPELLADGFMKSKKSKVTMEMTPSDILINGKILNDTLESKYCDILSKYGMRKGGNKRIVMQPNMLSVSIDDNTQISFGTFEHEKN